MTFIELTDRAGEKIWVDPRYVQAVTVDDFVDNASTQVWLMGSAAVFVSEPPREVLRRLAAGADA